MNHAEQPSVLGWAAVPAATIDDLRLAVERGPVALHGAVRSLAAYAASALLEDAAPSAAPRLIVVAPDNASARRFAADLCFFLPRPGNTADATIDSSSANDMDQEAAAGLAGPEAPPHALVIPAIDTSPYAELSPDRIAQAERLAALYRLARGGTLAPQAVVLSASAMLRRVVPASQLLALSRSYAVGDEIDRDETVTALLAAGYERVQVVEDPGSFAVRGGIIDLFPAMYAYPARLDLFGDEIESLRLFDPTTQRTLRDISHLHVHVARDTVVSANADLRARVLAAADAATHPSRQTRALLEQLATGATFVGIETLTPAFHARLDPLWSYLPAADNTLWLVIDPDAITGAVGDELELARARFSDRIDDHKLAFPPDDHYVSAAQLDDALATPRRRIELRSIELATGDSSVAKLRLAADDNLAIRVELERTRQQQADELIRPLVDAIERWRNDHWRVAIACDDASRTKRLTGLLREYEVEPLLSDSPAAALAELEPGAPPTLVRGSLGAGFSVASESLVVLTADDIFGERVHRSRASKRAAKRARDALLGSVSDFSQLGLGDFLVHDLHGVGIYKGLTKLPMRDTAIDFLEIEYRGGTLYLPVYRLGEVQRYVGTEGRTPRVDKLGGISFQKRKSKVSREVHQLAEELLQIYAQRASLPGHAFPPGDAMFSEFEATFPHEETPDQQRAIDDVIADMEKPLPMDRLVCGDVGYGKTEIALRAAFKAVLGNRQVAILAPTTVLVEQHYRTMVQRFAGWPVNVARLSRFQPRKQLLETIAAIAAGRVDVVVGTHRLLSRDVHFKELGLLVIDEEQRFGVAHKERLKRLKTQIDVLTLTATPIPRTLHLAMAGLRNLSIIATPPADRRSIRTFVSREDDGVMREAIRRELARSGQVFFVAPRIQQNGPNHRSLQDWAEHLEALVPSARVGVAHGQMTETVLEKKMLGFVAGDFDILVSTTIVESGLDIPRANTMFIARADAFGLAQLYQLRGRIGRSKERAFCYLLVPAPEKLSDEARRRLEALQRFTELGAGFQIASHDLEIRGAGELLGRKQSGSIASVGFEAYTVMLEDAVSELQGQPIRRPRDPVLNVDVPGYIPEEYVPDMGQRLDLYKRLASTSDDEEIDELLSEVADRYGPLPDELQHLADLSRLRIAAAAVGAQSVDLTGTRLSLALGEDTPLSVEAIAALVQRPRSRWGLGPDMRLQRRFDELEREDPSAAACACLLELAACAT